MLKSIVTTLLLLTASLTGISQSDEAGLKVLNYQDLTTIQRWNKLEMGVKLPDQLLAKIDNFVKETRVAASEKINPFLQWELDVEAQMTHTETGTVKKIPAFYYREYERDAAKDSWSEVMTPYPMRIRFAPSLPGKWSCTVTIKVKDKQLGETLTTDFVVVESRNKGFVSVHPNKRNFQLDGQIIYPVGTNFPSPTKGVKVYHTGTNGDVFSPKETYKVTTLNDWLSYHDDIMNYQKQGGKFIRVLQSGWSSLIEFEKKGNYYDRQPYAWEQDRLLEFCEQNGVYVHFDLMQQEPFMKYGNYDMFDWDWSHYRGDKTYFDQDIFPQYCYANGNKKEPYESLSSEDDLRYHEQRTRYYIARYGYSTSIYLFELMSEPWHIGQFGGHEEPYIVDDETGRTTRKAVQIYHERLATYIKQTLGHTNQLVGVDIYTAKFYEGETFIDQSIYNPNIDVIGFNPYSTYPDKMIIAKSTPNNELGETENSMARMVLSLNSRTGKPIMIAEGGAGDGVDPCSAYAQQYLDMMSFGFSGLAGYNSWIGWAEKEEMQWFSVIGAQQFMNGPQVTTTLSTGQGQWIQGRQAERHLKSDDKKGKELQYYISQDLKTVVGYVKNRSFNYNTKRTSDACANPNLQVPLNGLRDMNWADGNKPLYIDGLDRTKSYIISWYDYKTGAVISTQCQKAKRGRFRLQFPDLTVTEGKPERPEVWFSMVQGECSE